MGWLWHSTPESVENGEISILAIAETVVGMGLAFYAAYHWQTLFFIAISACIAPMLLLRTKESTELGLRWFERITLAVAAGMIIDTSLLMLFLFCSSIPLFIFIYVEMQIIVDEHSTLFISTSCILFLFFFHFLDIIEKRSIKVRIPSRGMITGTAIILIGVISRVVSKDYGLYIFLTICTIIFLYRVLTNEFIKGKKSLNLIKSRMLAIPIRFIGMVLAISLFTLTIRIISTVRSFLLKPFLAISEIPRNWYRVALVTDVFFYPELVPGINKLPNDSEISVFTFSSIFKYLPNQPDKRLDNLFDKLYILIFFLPSLLYRFSLKSTSIIYLPFIWVIHATLNDKAPIQHKLEDFMEAKIWKLTQIYSGFIIIFDFAQLGLSKWLYDFNQMLIETFGHNISQFFRIYLFLNENGQWHLNGWQIAGFINAWITIGILYLYADAAQRKLKRDPGASTTWIERIIKTSLFTRGILSIYIIGCVGYLFIYNSVIPQVAIDWLPKGLIDFLAVYMKMPG